MNERIICCGLTGVVSIVIALSVGGCAGTARRTQVPEPSVHTLAVLYFENNSPTDSVAQDAWKKVIADVLTTELTSVPGLSVVERRRLEDVLTELSMSSTDLADSETQLRLGRLLGARSLVVGDYVAFGSALRLDARIVDVETGRILYSQDVTGPRSQMFGLVWMLAARLSSALGSELPDIPRAGTVGSSVVPAYARGLDLFDSGDYEGARRAFEEVLEKDPGNTGARARIDQIDELE